MAKKKNKVTVWEFIKKHPILFNMVAILLVVILLLVGVFVWLNTYTRHGQAEVVPDVRGMSVEQAMLVLANKGMQCSVVDSVFIPDAQPGVVLEQSPVSESSVKSGRRIYVVVNALSSQMITFPDVVDMSLRQARVQIESADFVIKEVKYEPSAYKDLVLYADYMGDTIQVAQKIPYRSEVVLHVGMGDAVTPVLDSLATETDVDAAIEEVIFGEEFSF